MALALSLLFDPRHMRSAGYMERASGVQDPIEARRQPWQPLNYG